jgi:hypothetical protein
MEYIVVGILFLLVIILGIILNKQSKRIEQLNTTNLEQIKQHYADEYKAAERGFEKEYQLLKQNYRKEEKGLSDRLDNLAELLKGKEEHYNEVNQDLDLYREGKIKEINSAAAEYEKHQRLIVDNSIEDYREIKTTDFIRQLCTFADDFNNAKEVYDQIKSELEEERRKRQTINEEILRQRALDEQQDFYRIQISDEDKRDIDILRDVVPRLRRPDAVSKIIWTNYYQKPLAELRKRLLPNGDISGIYKITRIKTGEIYIGKSTTIDKRWQEHVKTALGCGTLASTQLHRIMASDGPENFTFEVLEETPKEKLFEREAYYIDFYDSKMYGLNTVTGEKNK